LWQDSGKYLEGTIDSVNPDGSFNVTYDAMVEGTISQERNVSKERLTLIEDRERNDSYWVDSQNVSTYPQQNTLESNFVVEKICKV
jgi:hypothetical protein